MMSSGGAIVISNEAMYVFEDVVVEEEDLE